MSDWNRAQILQWYGQLIRFNTNPAKKINLHYLLFLPILQRVLDNVLISLMKHCTLALSKKLVQVVFYHHPLNQFLHNLGVLIID